MIRYVWNTSSMHAAPRKVPQLYSDTVLYKPYSGQTSLPFKGPGGSLGTPL